MRHSVELAVAGVVIAATFTPRHATSVVPAVGHDNHLRSVRDSSFGGDPKQASIPLASNVTTTTQTFVKHALSDLQKATELVTLLGPLSSEDDDATLDAKLDALFAMRDASLAAGMDTWDAHRVQKEMDALRRRSADE